MVVLVLAYQNRACFGWRVNNHLNNLWTGFILCLRAFAAVIPSCQTFNSFSCPLNFPLGIEEICCYNLFRRFDTVEEFEKLVNLWFALDLVWIATLSISNSSASSSVSSPITPDPELYSVSLILLMIRQFSS